MPFRWRGVVGEQGVLFLEINILLHLEVLNVIKLHKWPGKPSYH